MRCQEIQRELLAYDKEELDEVDAKDIEGHLANCGDCRQEYYLLLAHLRLYRMLTPVESDTDSTSLLMRIEREKLTSVPTRRFYHRKTTVLTATLFLAVFFCCLYFFGTLEWGPRLKVLHGPIEIDGKVVDSSPSFPLHHGMQLRTQRWTTAKCRLTADLTFTLGSESSANIQDPFHIVLQEGKIFVKVENGRKLTILTANGEARVKGTAFQIDAATKDCTIEVFEGQVWFHNEYGAVDIKKGQGITISRGQKILSPTKLKRTSWPWWEDGPLSIILQVVVSNSNYHLRVAIKNHGQKKLTLTPFAANSPHLLLHVNSNGRSYITPLRTYLESTGSKPLIVSSGETKILRCNISPLIERPGDYTFTAIYQGENSSQNWNGLLSSPPIKIEVSR